GSAPGGADEPVPLDHSLNLDTLELQTYSEPPRDFVTARHELRDWKVTEDTAKREFVVTRKGNEVTRLKTRCCTLAAGPKGVMLLAAAEKGGLLVRVPPGQADAPVYEREYGSVRDVVVSPDGNLILTVTSLNLLQVYSLAKMKLLLSVYPS